MPTNDSLPCGLYETLLDEDLAALLESRPDLLATLVAVDDESAPHTYSQFLWQVIRKALPIAKNEHQVEIVNRLIELLSVEDGLDYTRRKILLKRPKALLREVRPVSVRQSLLRPVTPLNISSLLTGSCNDPQLEHELKTDDDCGSCRHPCVVHQIRRSPFAAPGF